MDNDNKAPVASEQEEVTEDTSETTPEVDSDEELAKAKELANNYKIRAEKAEKALKERKTPENQAPAPSQDNLSTADTLALVQAQVNPEDVGEVLEYAKFKKISVLEALKSNVVKTMLSDRAEERKTAAATHTGTTRRAPQKVSPDVLIAKAAEGELPDSDEEMARLWKARKNLN